MLPSITSGLEANLCLYEPSISLRNDSSSIMPVTLTIAASIGELGKYFPRAATEIFLASIVYTLPSYPLRRGLISSGVLAELITIAPSFLRPFVTSTHSRSVSSTTTTYSGS